MKIFLPALFSLATLAAKGAPLPEGLSAYKLDETRQPDGLQLKQGDRLAICGDSITEQKMYSVLMETYLTACVPDLKVTCRQYGWSGEQASGFRGRMKDDVLRFKPTIATTCYGMNDFKYVPFQDDIAATYRENQTAVAKAFKDAGCRVVLGSTGIIDSVPPWVKGAAGTQLDLNLALSKFRNIDIAIAKDNGLVFADVYRPMLLADYDDDQRLGEDFKLAGKDGVHPNWAGHVVMAYAFLKAFGLDGDLGSITYDESSSKATASGGHEVTAVADGKISIRSSRVPVAFGPGPLDRDDSPRAGLALIPFDDELNRFVLKIASPKAANYHVTWGAASKDFTAAQMTTGINLAKEFDANPLVEPFKKVLGAVSKKQEYETRQIKNLAHGPEGAADLDGTFAVTEKARQPLADAVAKSLEPVTHEITVKPVP